MSGKKGYRKSRWRRITDFIARHGRDGWVSRQMLTEGLSPSMTAAIIEATLKDHHDEVDIRVVANAAGGKTGRPRTEVRLHARD